jgi:hypothetical protein
VEEASFLILEFPEDRADSYETAAAQSFLDGLDFWG